MNKGPIHFSIITIGACMILWSCNNVNKTHSTIEDLNAVIVELPPGSPISYPDSVFAMMDIPEEVKLFAMGEATHGTREFAELRLATFQYLVKEKGYRALVKEFSFRGSLALNDYIHNGQGDLDSILSAYGWIHHNAESQEVFNWMLEWNRGAKEGEKVCFFGNDTQLDMWHLEDLFSQMEKLDPVMYTQFRPYINSIADYEPFEYRDMPYDRYGLVYDLLLKLKASLKSYYEKNGTTSSSSVIIQLAEALIQSHKFLYHIYLPEDSKNYRELHLAQNTLWVLEQAGDDSRAMLWAHNAHIANNAGYMKHNGGSMGKHLNDLLHDNYYSIAVSFAKGSFVAVNQDSNGRDTPPRINTIRTSPPRNSVNHLLSQAKYPNFILQLNGIQANTSLYSFLDTLRPFIDIGDLYLETADTHYTVELDAIVNVKRSFDMLVFFKETNPIRLGQ